MPAEALPITRQIEIIKKKKLAVPALDTDIKIFVIYVAALAE